MKVAIPQWQDRVSPVFDSATRLVVVEIVRGRAQDRSEWPLIACDPTRRAAELLQSGANVLICGAISWPMEIAVRSAGIQIVAQICGQVEEVLNAFLEDRLSDSAFLMPGCCGLRRRYRSDYDRHHRDKGSSIPGVSRRHHESDHERANPT
jgi:predicted Fe-Mo cluster-binding NifX family protein